MKIAGGLVTYNRLGLLKRAIDAALCQTRLADKFIIINNASTDGTAAYLATLRHPSIIVVNVQSNLGGAGGFAMALALASDLGCEAAWLFDDDGLPNPEELERLERGMVENALDLAGSLVVAEDSLQELAFGLGSEREGARSASLRTVAEAQAASANGVIVDMANPFNGTLVALGAIHVSGNVRPEMFIWGDEIEFVRRLIREGYRVATVVDAIHHHPRPKITVSPTIFGQANTPPRGREIHLYRNMAFNLRRHRGSLWSLAKMVQLALQQAFLGQISNFVFIPLWWLDGFLDSYRLRPSRTELVTAWNHARSEALNSIVPSQSNTKCEHADP